MDTRVNKYKSYRASILSDEAQPKVRPNDVARDTKVNTTGSLNTVCFNDFYGEIEKANKEAKAIENKEKRRNIIKYTIGGIIVLAIIVLIIIFAVVLFKK